MKIYNLLGTKYNYIYNISVQKSLTTKIFSIPNDFFNNFIEFVFKSSQQIK